MPKQVNIFFPSEAEPVDPEGNPFNLRPVQRTVDSKSPARMTLQELLKGPNEMEQAKGLMGLDAAGLSVGKLQIKNGVCTADFVSQGKKKWQGDVSSVVFRLAIEKSLVQFSTIKTVEVSVNGVLDFDSLQ